MKYLNLFCLNLDSISMFPSQKKWEDVWSNKEKHSQKGGLKDNGDSRKMHRDRNYGAWICQFEGDLLLSICSKARLHHCFEIWFVFKPNLRDMGWLAFDAQLGRKTPRLRGVWNFIIYYLRKAKIVHIYIYIRATPGVCPGVTLTIRASTIKNYHGINYHHFRVKVLGFQGFGFRVLGCKC